MYQSSVKFAFLFSTILNITIPYPKAALPIDQESTRFLSRGTNIRRIISTVQAALNRLTLCALFRRSRIWLIHCHPMYPVNTVQVTH
jgi:hypothetical protein